MVLRLSARRRWRGVCALSQVDATPGLATCGWQRDTITHMEHLGSAEAGEPPQPRPPLCLSCRHLALYPAIPAFTLYNHHGFHRKNPQTACTRCDRFAALATPSIHPRRPAVCSQLQRRNYSPLTKCAQNTMSFHHSTPTRSCRHFRSTADAHIPPLRNRSHDGRRRFQICERSDPPQGT
jgi:hypothetical protein